MAVMYFCDLCNKEVPLSKRLTTKPDFYEVVLQTPEQYLEGLRGAAFDDYTKASKFNVCSSCHRKVEDFVDSLKVE